MSTPSKKQQRDLIDQKLVRSGEKDKQKEFLRTKLTESGWRDDMKKACKEIVKAKGMEQITVEELIAEIGPKARNAVPEDIKAELLQRIRKAISDP